MYNLYTQEKLINEELNKKKEEEFRLRYKEKHKKLLTSMYENYENRVKNFITDMTHPNQVIILQDNPKIYNSRAALMNEREIMKSFVFKGYKTEKERIADNLKNNIYLFSYDQGISKAKSKGKSRSPNNRSIDSLVSPTSGGLASLYKSTPYSLKKKQAEALNAFIVQPEMRFKPRTDLERVFDTINGNYLKETDRQILNRQLQLLDLLTYRKPSSNTLSGIITKMSQQGNNKEDDDDYNNNNANSNKNKGKGIGFGSNDPNGHIIKSGHGKSPIRRNDKQIIGISPRKPWVKRIDLNTEAKGILSEYYVKTHFKAAEEIAEGKIVVQPKKDKNHFDEQFTSPSSPHNNTVNKRFKHNTLPSTLRSPGRNNKDNHFNSTLNDNGNNEYNSIMSYDNYDKNTNPIVSKRYDKVDPNQMTQLSKLAFTQPKEEGDDQLNTNKTVVLNNAHNYNPNVNANVNNINTKKSLKNKITIVDDNNVFIDNELYNKGTQLDIIAAKVLNKCNVYHNKSLHNNTMLKKSEGKLMFTNGLSISQFAKKYNLQ